MSDITPYRTSLPAHLTRRQTNELEALQFRGLLEAKRIESEAGKAALGVTALGMAGSLAIAHQEQLAGQATLAAQRTPNCGGHVLAILDSVNRQMCARIDRLGRDI